MQPSRPVRSALSALVIAVLAGCGQPATAHAPDTGRRAVPAGVEVGGMTVAPSETFAVGVRRLALRRRDRALPTTVWYPAAGTAGGGPRGNAAPARGRFPLVLFSHGLHGLPEHYQALTTRWAAAGFVVAAPVYPHTNKRAQRFERDDVRHQPADAAHVLAEVAKLDTRAGDPLAGHLDTAHLAAAGYSAGGFTTSGVFVRGRDRRLRCAIVIAGGASDGAFTGSAAPVLFVHGDRDPTVAYARGRAAYDRLRWPKAFLTLFGQGHGEYLTADVPGYAQALRTTTDFLRWALYGDQAARRRLPADGNLAGVSALSERL